MNQEINIEQPLINDNTSSSSLDDEFFNYLPKNQTEYDPFKIPPDIMAAIKHGQANRVHKPIQNIQQIKDKICPCCGKTFNNEQYQICCNTDDLRHLGTSFPLYFSFIKICFVVFLLHFLLSSLANLIINTNGKSCSALYQDNIVCQWSFTNILSKNKKDLIGIESILNFVTVIVLIIVIELSKIRQKKHCKKLERKRKSVSNYSIMITNLDKQKVIKIEEVEAFISEKLSHNCDISRIYLMYDMKRYSMLYKTKKQLINDRLNSYVLREQFIDKLAQVENNNFIRKTYYQTQVDSVNKQIQNQTEELKRVEQELINFEILFQGESNLQNMQKLIPFSGKVLITFNSVQQQKEISKMMKKNLKQKFYSFLYPRFFKQKAKEELKNFIFDDKLLKIKKAPEPTDIQWANIGSTSPKIKIRIISYLIILATMTIAFLLILLFKRFIKVNNDITSEETTDLIIISLISSTCVALTNTLLGIIIRKGARLSEHSKQTTYFVSVGKKLTRVFMINMVLTTLLSNMANYFIRSTKIFPFDLQGLVNDFFFLFITNSYMSSIFNYFDLVWGYRLLKRRKIEKQQLIATQQQTNLIYEGHPVDLALRYANILKTVLFTASVSPFIPIGIPLSMVGLVISYWVDKFLLLRRYTCQNFLSYKLAKSMIDQFSLYTVFFSLGNFVTMFMPVHQTEVIEHKSDQFIWPQFQNTPFFYIAFFGFIVSLIARYTPIQGINRIYQIFYKNQPEKSQIIESYQQVRNEFIEDYDLYQPPVKDNIPNDQNSQILFQQKKKIALSSSEITHVFKSIRNYIDSFDKIDI